jgi:hypothetical protein
LSDTIDLSGFGKTFGLGQVAENFQTFDLHLEIEYAMETIPSTGLALKVFPEASAGPELV